MSRGRLLLGLMLLALIYVALSQTESDVSVPDEPTTIEDAGDLVTLDGEDRDAAADDPAYDASDASDASDGDTSEGGASEPDASDDGGSVDAEQPADAELDPLPDAGGSASGASVSGDEDILLVLVNDVRAEVDLPPVLADADLTAAARSHSADMADGGFCAHDGSDGMDVAERLAAFGFDGRRHGEVISCRTDSPAEAMAQWLRSPGHRDIILEERFTLAGAGVASTNGNGSMWTMTFGAD